MRPLFKLPLLFIILIVFASCKTQNETIQGGASETGGSGSLSALAGEKCTLEEVTEESAMLVCPDGTSFLISSGMNGADGINGQNGTDGMNGADGINGQNGTDGVNGADGINGQNGTDGMNGINGINGIDGDSCSVTMQVGVGALIQCGEGENLTAALIYNGVDGVNGQDGVDGVTCKVTPVPDLGAVVECGEGENKTTVFIEDGQDGADGISGEDDSDD